MRIRINKQIETFTDKYPLIGPTMWMLSVQYFIIQIIVAHAWSISYSPSNNTISDLGNSACGVYAGRYVCSPLHSLMNASFITLGLFMVIGSMLIYQEFKETRLAFYGFLSLFIAGVGTLLVGLFPENTIAALHLIGAILPFLIGNIGIIILGIALSIPKPLRMFSIFVGSISLLALLLFLTHQYLGIGIGSMERIAAYPQTIWLIVFGIYMSKNHFTQDRGSL